ncbi:MAG: hypothetical protein PHZ00_04900 [Candidatus Peribacteraceae bacterium]|nr:hypothetical protein [Candidatus Peribacteraceae bacterium]
MKSDAISEGIGVSILIETDQDADAVVADIRETFAGIIYHKVLVLHVTDGKATIGISVPTCQTLNDLLSITAILKEKYKILSGTFGDWKFEAESKPV